MISQISIEVTGKVQGVFFRASTQKQAISLGLCGFVMNKPNGCVYMTVQGSEKGIQELIEWCKTGPILSKVDSVTVIEETEISEFDGFEIRR